MTNIIQTAFLLIPYFSIEYFSLLPIFWLILMGLLIEKHYVSRLTFFSNSVALVSYFGLKENVQVFGGLIMVLYFSLASWSFLSYATKNKIPCFEKYEKFVENNPWLLKVGSSLIVGIIIFADAFNLF